MRFSFWVFLPIIILAGAMCWQQAHGPDYPKAYAVLTVLWAAAFVGCIIAPFIIDKLI